MLKSIYVCIIGTTALKRRCPKLTTKAQPVTMITNSEINETGNIFSHPFLVLPAGFLKSQLPPPPYH